MSKMTIALAGNPNSGKTTLFNLLTGSNQYVGNWPGVTIERKEGYYLKDKEIKIVDLPGIYSLSPYSPEEVVSRDFLIDEKPDLIINIVDATNLERNLYLTTQLMELNIPVVIALNMMDIVEKTGLKLDIKSLKKYMKCEVATVSALKGTGIDELMQICIDRVNRGKQEYVIFDENVESKLNEIRDKIVIEETDNDYRWNSIKLLENDKKIIEKLGLNEKDRVELERVQKELFEEFEDDGEGVITNERYNFVSSVVEKSLTKSNKGESASDKIDKILTNRILAFPIFILIMTGIYYVAMKIVGGPVTDWVNEVFFAEIIGENTRNFLMSVDTAPWLVSLIVDGIINGVGSVLGFLPVIAALYLFIALLEDIGYMSRIAFILDRIFRRLGLSGKSFIPIIMGMGCSVPGIMATRTIESEKDRRMTIIVASFMPCGAKTEIIALLTASVFAGKWWFAPLCYFAGILAVIISGLILKKTSMFVGDTTPFVMELPSYHAPKFSNIFKVTWTRIKSFIIKAGTIILVATVVLWFLMNFSLTGEFHEFSGSSHSILEGIGKVISPIFTPLGFGNWLAAVSTVVGLVAKELVVSTYGLVAGIGADLTAESADMINYANLAFTSVSALSFMIFNQLSIPCFAAIGAIKNEMKDTKWTLFALGYQIVFAYCISLMIYQFGRVIVLGDGFNIWTYISIGVALIFIYLLFKPDPNKSKSKE
ncbi:ferrous iron transport protein B [Lagierella sp.]|uniref:ferrous iron transport protein B n=1 Tax=Lagierella sp. TaxID=2849657 RepID=UPI002620DEC4|nr:ferrous iron transport protein B [Lagierella sp.]